MNFGRKLLLSGVAFGALSSTTVSWAAQTAAQPPVAEAAPAHSAAQAAKPEPAEREIVVTGTSIRGVAAVGSPVVSVGRDQLSQSVRSSPVDVLREVPQVQGLGFDDTPRVTNNGNIQRGRTINLRGIGANATLLLVDGNRVSPTGNVFSFTDADQLPTAAIERIEVVAEGASAIYGSDAVAGVVNYITRKSFQGIEVSGRGSVADGYKQYGGSIVGGLRWSSGSIVAAYDYDQRTDMRAGESPFMRSDLRPLGGPDNRISLNTGEFGEPGSVIVPRTTTNPTIPGAGLFDYYTPMAGASGRLTVANMILNNPALLDGSDYTTYLPAYKRHQVSVSLRQELTPWLTASGLAFFNTKHSETYSFAVNPATTSVTVGPTSPFYVSGIPGIAPTARQTVGLSFIGDIGAPFRDQFNTQYQATGNLRAELFSGWVGQGIVNYSRNRNCALCIDALRGNVNATALQAAVDAGLYNPLSATPASADVLATFMPAAYDKNRSSLTEYTLRFDGPLFTLPGGQMKAAFGGSYMEIDQFRTAQGQGARDVAGVYAKRNVRAGYAELYVPLLGEDFTLPAVQRLVLSLAVRSEKYSDFGSTTNPKVGVDWLVTDGLKLRGSWGKSFRAPNLIEINPSFFTNVTVSNITNRANDPTIPVSNTATSQTTVVRLTGSTANLEPETAKTFSAGFDFTPRAIPGLNLSSTYYDVQYDNQIITLNALSTTFLASAANRALYANYITAAPQPVTCVNGVPSTYNPLYLPLLATATSAGVAINQSTFCSSRAILFGGNTNASSVRQRGIDFNGTYAFDSLDSDWRFNVNGTKILSNKLRVVPGGAVVDALDVINQPVSIRGRASLSWSKGPLMVIPSVNYVGGYRNNLPLTINGVTQPEADIPGWTTFDLVAVLRFEQLSLWGKGTELTLNVRNLFDEDPPLVLSTNGFAFDNQVANPFGRIVSVQLTKRF